MTSGTTQPPAPAVRQKPVATAPAQVTEPDARFRDLLAAEWTKLWSLRSTVWAFVVSALAVVGLNVNAAWADYRNLAGYSAEERRDYGPFVAVRDVFTSGAGATLLLALGAIGAVIVVGEHTTGLIRTTFAAVPARRSVMAAKVVVVTAATSAFGLVVVIVSFVSTQAILSRRDVSVSITDPGVVRAVAASALLAPLAALVGMAVAAVTRHSAVSIVGTVVLLLVAPLLVTETRRLTAVLAHTMPLNAWERLRDTRGPELMHDFYPWTVNGAWTVYVVWAVVAVVLTIGTVHRRDQ